MDWQLVRRRLRKNHAPWDRDKSQFFVDTVDEWGIHQRARKVILSTWENENEEEESIDIFSTRGLEQLGILTPTLSRLLKQGLEEHGDLRTYQRIRAVIHDITGDPQFLSRDSVCKVMACEVLVQKFQARRIPGAAIMEFFGRKMSPSFIHESGILSELPEVSRDVALWDFMWLLFGKGLDPHSSVYPAVPADIRWTDAFVRYVDPAARGVTAHRMGIRDHPEFKTAIRELEKCGKNYECTQVDTLLGEKGFQWFVENEEWGPGPKNVESLVDAYFVDAEADWQKLVAQCRRMIGEQQEREGLTEEALRGAFASQFPERAWWSSLDAAMSDAHRPFGMAPSDQQRLPEYLLADLWSEYFGELAIQLAVMRQYDRIVEPATEGAEPAAVLRRVERSLQSSICNLLKRKHGIDHWWVEGVPSNVRKSCANMHEEEKCRYSKESYLYLLDLFKIIKSNWQHFEKPITAALKVSSKTTCENWFGELNMLRNLNAHPLRGDLSDADQERLRAIDQEVGSLTARLEQIQVFG